MAENDPKKQPLKTKKVNGERNKEQLKKAMQQRDAEQEVIARQEKLADLVKVLERYGVIPSVLYLDGLCTAMACNREMIPSGAWFPFILRHDVRPSSEEESKMILESLQAFFTQTLNIVYKGYENLDEVLVDEDGNHDMTIDQARIWSQGFMTGCFMPQFPLVISKDDMEVLMPMAELFFGTMEGQEAPAVEEIEEQKDSTDPSYYFKVLKNKAMQKVWTKETFVDEVKETPSHLHEIFKHFKKDTPLGGMIGGGTTGPSIN